MLSLTILAERFCHFAQFVKQHRVRTHVDSGRAWVAPSNNPMATRVASLCCVSFGRPSRRRRWIGVITHPACKCRHIHELALRSRLPPIVARESRRAAPVLSVRAALLGRAPERGQR
jgi:hypothetical protein